MEGVLRETAIQAKSLLRGVCREGRGHREQGFRCAEIWVSVGIMTSWPHGTRTQGCRNQELRNTGTRDTENRDSGVLELGFRLEPWLPGNSQVPWLPDKGLSVGVHSWLPGNLRILWPQGYREAVTLAGRSTVRRGLTLSGRAQHWLTAFVTPAGCAQCCQIPGGMLHLE